MSSPSPVLVALFAGAAALSLGLVLGAIGPQSEVRRLRAKVELLEERPCNIGIGRNIATVLQGAGRMSATPAPAAAPEPTPNPDGQGVNADGQWVNAGEGDGTRISVKVGDAPATGLDSDMGVAATEALALRRAQMRAVLMEQARPSTAQIASIDQVIEDMNIELLALSEDLVARIAAGDSIERRDAMAIAIDALDLFVATEDRLRGSLSVEQLAGLSDDVLDPFAFVDPAVVEAFLGLDD